MDKLKDISFPFTFNEKINVDLDPDNSDKIVITNNNSMKDTEFEELFGKLASSERRKVLVRCFIEVLKYLGDKNLVVANYIYNFILTTDLMEKYLLPGIDIRQIVLDVYTNTLEVYERGITSIPSLVLKFTEYKDEDTYYSCEFMILHKCNSFIDFNYICRELIVYPNHINDNTYRLIEYNKTSSTDRYKFKEFADYNGYTFTDIMDIRITAKYAINSICSGESPIKDVNLKYSTNIESYTGAAELQVFKDNINTLVYRGTYNHNDTPVCNITRTYDPITNNSSLKSMDRYKSYYNYDIHNILFKDERGAKGFINVIVFPEDVRITSETIEFTEDFYKEYRNILHDLPSSKNYYYYDNRILEISYSEFKRDGKKLKRNYTYYKLIQIDDNGNDKIYVKQPDFDSIYEYAYESGDKEGLKYSSKYNSNELMIASIEDKIKATCEKIGVRYK